MQSGPTWWALSRTRVTHAELECTDRQNSDIQGTFQTGMTDRDDSKTSVILGHVAEGTGGSGNAADGFSRSFFVILRQFVNSRCCPHFFFASAERNEELRAQ